MTRDDWRSLYEVSTRAWSSGAREAGRWASERLLSQEDVPADVRRQVRAHQLAYARRLIDLVPSARLRRLRFPTRTRWSLFNPTIAATTSGYVMLVRSSNFVTDGLAYTIVGDDTCIRTENYLVSLDRRLNIVSVRPVRTEASNQALYPCAIVGIEDCRIFRYQSGWHVSANAREYNPAGICQILMARLEDQALRDVVLLSDADRGIHEKNWMPLVTGGELYFIYSCHPTVVLKYDEQHRRVVEWSRDTGPALGSDFRGGSQAVQLGKTILFASHEQIRDAVGRVFYLHRFVLMNDRFAITHVSPQFYFMDVTIEFCAGLAVRGDRLVLSFGYRDRASYLATMRLDDALATLRPVRRCAGWGAGGGDAGAARRVL